MRKSENMSDEKPEKSALLDREKLPNMFPTHRYAPEFWEHLGRAIASFGFLEEILWKAIAIFTVTRRYGPDEIDLDNPDEIKKVLKEQRQKLEQALTYPLVKLANAYGEAAKCHQTSTDDIPDLVQKIKKAADIRNVLCHGSWNAPDANGASVPFFVNWEQGRFDSPIDIAYLQQVHNHAVELSCDVIDTVTRMGWKFPGSNSPGNSI